MKIKMAINFVFDFASTEIYFFQNKIQQREREREREKKIKTIKILFSLNNTEYEI